MSSLTGTWALVRLFLRLDRLRLPVWVLVLGVVPVGTASALQSLYATEASRLELAATVTSNPAFIALLGPLYDSSIGGLTAWRIGTLGSFIVGLMGVLTMIRHTRDDEETGRRELLGSTLVGRHAPLAAAMVVTAGAGLVIGVIIAGGLAGIGLPLRGSIAFGAGFAAVAVAFTAAGALTAQFTQAGSTGRGLGVAIVGLLFVLRMAGDVGEADGLGWLSWLSPIGWFSRMRAFAGERWWVFALWMGLTVVLAAIAAVIQSRRDVGAGAIPPRSGPMRAPRYLSSLAGLAWRLHRGSLLGWTAGLAVLGATYGSAADSVGDLLRDNPQLEEIIERLGGTQTITDAFFSTVAGILALIAAAYSIRTVLKLDGEEGSLRTEFVLATATTRFRHAWSHLFYGLAGPVLLLAVAGTVTGATYGLIVGDIVNETPRVLMASLAQVPAVWVLTAVAMALYGTAPKWSSFSWGALVVCLILGQLGQILQFPQWTLNLSPFTHVPMVPGQDFRATPFIWLLAVSVALIASGLIVFRRRDIPAT